MDFDLDDPLGDLLSDGSNDSFFGSSKLKKNVNASRASVANVATPIGSTKTKMQDLFGLSSVKTEEKAPDTASLYGINSSDNKRTTAVRPSVQAQEQDVSKKRTPEVTRQAEVPKPLPKKELSFEDSGDFLSELGFDPKRPKGSGHKANILDDLLGISDTRSVPPTPTTPAAREVPKTPPRPRQLPELDIGSLSSADVGRNSSRYSPSLGRSRATPRMNSGTSLNDPLGFFSTPLADDLHKNAEPDDIRSTRLAKKPLSVDWLGLESNAQTSGSSSQAKQLTSTSIIAPLTMPQPIQQTVSNIATPSTGYPLNSDLTQNINLMRTTNAEGEAALQVLQQNDSQLQMAVQMRNQETALLEMQTKQQDLLKQQEVQFNDLLRRQLNRQSALEESIKRQQEQINSHIYALLSQPIIGPASQNEAVTEEGIAEATVGSHANITTTKIELQAEVKKLELEKLRLEDLLQNIRGNHEQELDLIENSYKKQVQMLQEYIGNLELRLSDENGSLRDFYLKKVTLLELQLNEANERYSKDMNNLRQEQDDLLLKLRKTHEIEIETMRSEHHTMIQNIRESKLLEFAVVQENGSYLSTLKSASSQLENASENIQTLRLEMEEKVDRLHREREIQLEIKEKRLTDLQKNVERAQENAETERIRLLELVKSLELKLNSLEQTSAEEQWSLRQQRNSLEAEKLSFEREKEFIREKQLADEKRIQDLRNQQIIDYKRLMNQLDDEKNNILMEKSKLETLERLQIHPKQSTLSRCEIDTAVKVAQDAAQECDIERSKLIELQMSFEMKKRELMNQEQIVQNKGAELATNLQEATEQKQEAEYATKAAKILEQKLMTKLHQLQRNFNELSERESKLSYEKLELSKERMELQVLRRKLFQGRCSLCKIGERSREISNLLTNAEEQELSNTQQNGNQLPIDGMSLLNDIDIKIPDEINALDGNTSIDNVMDAHVAASMNRINRMGRQFQFNLAAVPDITDISDNLLDPNLQMVKLHALNSRTFL